MPEVTYRVAREYDVVKVKVSKEGQERIDRLLPDHRCLGCERKLAADERSTCGNCDTCYNAVLRAGNAARTQAMKEGKTLAPTRGGRKFANEFTKELAEL